MKSAFSKSLCSGRNRKVPGRFPEANPEAKQGIAKTCVPEAKRKVPGRFPEANPEALVGRCAKIEKVALVRTISFFLFLKRVINRKVPGSLSEGLVTFCAVWRPSAGSSHQY